MVNAALFPRTIQVLTVSVAALLLTFTSGCGTTESGIRGQLTGAEGAEVRLATFGNRGFIDLDTVMADANGSFTIPNTVLQDLALDVYKVQVAKQHFFVFADSLTSMSITGNITDESGLATDITVTGDRWTADFADFIRTVTVLNDSMAVAKSTASGGGTPQVQLAAKKEFDAIRDRYNTYVKKTIRGHKSDPVGLMALEHLDLSADRLLAEQVVDSTRTLMGHSVAYRNLSNRVKSQPKARTSSRRNDLIKPGMAMPDIALNDPSGQERALSDLRGKVVLVDFWASWCGPCRRENPNVVRAWNEYKDQGFEVFSVSLDKDVKKWERAIAQDGLAWPNHISDLRGWNSVATSLYGISSIPHAILIDRDGTVVSTHLRGAQLEAELERLL